MVIIGSHAIAMFIPDWMNGRNTMDYDFIATKAEMQSLIKQMLTRHKLIKLAFKDGTNKACAFFFNKDTNKQFVLEFNLVDEEFRDKSTWQSASALQSVTAENSRLQTKIEGMINQMLGSDKTKVDVEASTQITKAQEAIYAQEVFDPINAPEVLKKLKDEIDQIKSELDFILSESNASTQIDVDFMQS